MGARVAAEVVKAAGLGALCVGETNTETLDKLARYKHSKELQTRAREHLQKIRQQEFGLLTDGWTVLHGRRGRRGPPGSQAAHCQDSEAQAH